MKVDRAMQFQSFSEGVHRDGAEVTLASRSFHVRAPATRKARRPIVGSLTAETSRSSDEEDRSLCRDGMSAIGVNCRRYCGASVWELDRLLPGEGGQMSKCIRACGIN